jgi:hypothetical protein
MASLADAVVLDPESMAPSNCSADHRSCERQWPLKMKGK